MDFILREWKYEDASQLAEAADNPNIAKNLRNAFPNPYSLDDAKQFLNSCIPDEGKNQLFRAIEAGKKVIGGISISVMDDVYEKSAELGYWLSEDYWRQGITSHAVQMICREAFARFDIIRIFAEPFEHNAGSRRVLEKADFTYEGTMRSGVYKNGEIHSYCMYSLLRGELES